MTVDVALGVRAKLLLGTCREFAALVAPFSGLSVCMCWVDASAGCDKHLKGSNSYEHTSKSAIRFHAASRLSFQRILRKLPAILQSCMALSVNVGAAPEKLVVGAELWWLWKNDICLLSDIVAIDDMLDLFWDIRGSLLGELTED